ncbi:hypothetical protein HK097_011042 [Rhizophlyctis rosea]|uniref:Ankyrin repeat protein n=1 Tax=Rhizophlyctis rosea TaxID=64517 RepID=A0AAD5S883_9FUNG|nr:hypothetical protein HK097_011042 [Rhizophlyctis rosea]
MAAALDKSYKAALTAATTVSQRKQLLSDVIAEENQYRKLFAQEPNNAKIKDPYVSLVPIHADESVWRAWGQQEDPASVLMPLDSKLRAKAGTQMVADKTEFLLNWRILTEGSLHFLDWSNIFAAGGSVLACLSPVPVEHDTPAACRNYFREKYPGSDIDLFIYGLDEAGAKAKMEQIYNCIIDACPFETTVFRTAHAVTIVSEYPYRHVQIVLRLYKSPAEILMGFDVDSCGVGFDGKHVWATRRAHLAIIAQANTIDMTRRSPSYEMRLAKYADRGFEIHVPTIDRSRIDPQIYERSYNKVNGLARLLVLEALRDQQKRLNFKEHQRKRRLRPPHENAGNYASLSWARSGDLKAGSVDANDYQSVLLAWGPKWTAKRLTKLAHKKDFMLNNPYLMHKWRKTRHHQHPTFYGTMSDIFEDCCGQCPPLPPDYDPEEKNLYVSGALSFLSDNPGRQSIGSFNPITDEDWTEDAYIPSSIDPILHAIAGDDVTAVLTLLDNTQTDINRRDWVGRTFLQFATFCNSKKVVEGLIERGARISYTLPDGRTALHVAAQYGFVEVAEMLLKRNRKNVEEREGREGGGGKTDQTAVKEAMTDDEEGGGEEEDQISKEDEDDEPTSEIPVEDSDAPEAEYESVTHDDLSEDDDYEKVKKPTKQTSSSGSEGEEPPEDKQEEEPEDDIIDLSFVDWDFKMSPLHFACFHGHAKVVKLLLEYGASGRQMVKYKNMGYRSAFLKDGYVPAASYGCYYLATLAVEEQDRMDVIEALVEAGVPCLPDDNRNTLSLQLFTEGREELALAIWKRWPELVKSKIDFMNSSYATVVSVAAENGKVAVVKELLDGGAAADPTLSACKDLIKYAIQKRTGMWELNYKYKSDPRVLQSTLPNVALFKAVSNGHHQSARLLLENGADVNRVVDSSATILDVITKKVEEVKKRVEDGKKEKVEKEETWSLKVGKEDPEGLEAFLLGTEALNPEEGDDEEKEVPITEEEEKSLEKYFASDADDEPAPSEDLLKKDKTTRADERFLRRLELCIKVLTEFSAKTFKELNPDIEVPDRQQWYNNYTSQSNDLGEDTIIANLYAGRILSADEGRAYYQLFQAAWTNDLETIRKLCVEASKEKRLLVTVQTRSEGITPLTVAAYKGHVECVKLLMTICGEQIKGVQKKGDKADRTMNNYRLDDESDDSCDESDDDGEEESDAEVSEEVWSEISQEDYLQRNGFIGNWFLKRKEWESEESREGPLVDAVKKKFEKKNTIRVTAMDVAIIRGHLEIVKVLMEVAGDIADVGFYPRDSTVAQIPPDQVMNPAVDLHAPAMKSELIRHSPIEWAYSVGSLEMLKLVLTEGFCGEWFNELFDLDKVWKEHRRKFEQVRRQTDQDVAQVAAPTGGATEARHYEGLKPKSKQQKEKKAEEEHDDEEEKEEDQKTIHHNSLLQRAAIFGRVDVIDYLLAGDHATQIINEAMSRNPSDPRTIYLSSLTPEQFSSAVKQILGTEVREGYRRSENALHWAVLNDAGDAIRALWRGLGEEGFRKMLEEHYRDENAVHIAAASGFVGSLQAIVEVAGTEVLQLEDRRRGWNVVHFAAHHNRLPIIEKLFELTPPETFTTLLTKQSTRFRHTPLMIATMRGYHRLVKVLREYTETASPIDFQGLHPLHLAIRGEHLSIVKEFLMSEDGNALNQEDASGFTPLGTAIQMLHHHLRDNDKQVLSAPEKVVDAKEEDLDGYGERKLGNRPAQVYKVVKDATKGSAAMREVVPLEVMSGATRVAIEIEDKGDRQLEADEGRSKY